MELNFSIDEIQVDNQLHFRGSYDFPVVLVGNKETHVQHLHSLNVPINQLVFEARTDPLILIECSFEIWNDTVQGAIITDMTDISVNIKPLRAYVEDTYITKLVEYLSVLAPTKLIIMSPLRRTYNFNLNSTLVNVPVAILFESPTLAKPLVLRSFVIEDLSVLLSVHSSIKIYIALDETPLQFARFEKKKLMTTAFR